MIINPDFSRFSIFYIPSNSFSQILGLIGVFLYEIQGASENEGTEAAK